MLVYTDKIMHGLNLYFSTIFPRTSMKENIIGIVNS